MFKLIKPYIPYWLLATLVGVFHIAIETAIYLKISEFIDQTIKFGNTDGFTRQVLYMLAMVAVLLPGLILGNYLRSGFVCQMHRFGAKKLRPPVVREKH